MNARERPILMSAPMIRAILDGTKTQTRRVVKQQPPTGHAWAGWCVASTHKADEIKATWATGTGPYLRDVHCVACPHGQPGERLWVREAFCPIYPQDPTYNGGQPIEYDYRATYSQGARLGDALGIKKRWKSSIHMPRAASRITLEITGVRVERLQEISEADANAEGVKHSLHLPGGRFARENFAHLWWTINGNGAWEANPWVWVIEFRRLCENGGAT